MVNNLLKGGEPSIVEDACHDVSGFPCRDFSELLSRNALKNNRSNIRLGKGISGSCYKDVAEHADQSLSLFKFLENAPRCVHCT